MAISKNTIKFVKSLQLKKFRQKYDIFVVEGDKMAREMLSQSAIVIDQLFCIEAWATANAGLLRNRNDIEMTIVLERELAQLSSLSTPNQVLLLAQIPKFKWPEPAEFTRALYIDGIQDPGNMGTILRIADWFGIPCVFCAEDCVDVFNPKVVQASMGAFLRVQTTEIALQELHNKYESTQVIGAFMHGGSAFEFEWPANGILVIGNEGAGIRPGHESLINWRVSIPKGPGAGAESLNAAVATGILCGTWVRVRG